jgi:hypothetical protein
LAEADKLRAGRNVADRELVREQFHGDAGHLVDGDDV